MGSPGEADHEAQELPRLSLSNFTAPFFGFVGFLVYVYSNPNKI
jgi:hypothetical protein